MPHRGARRDNPLSKGPWPMSYKVALASLLVVGCVDDQAEVPQAALTEVRVSYANAPAGTRVVFQAADDEVVADVPLVDGEATAEVPVGGNVTVISPEGVTYLLGVLPNDRFVIHDAELTSDFTSMVVSVPAAPNATVYQVSASCAPLVDGTVNAGYNLEAEATTVEVWVPNCAGATDLFVEALDGDTAGGFRVTDVAIAPITSVTGTYLPQVPVDFTATNLPTDQNGQLWVEAYAGDQTWRLPHEASTEYEPLPATATLTTPLPALPDLYVRGGLYLGNSPLDYQTISIEGPATALPTLDVAGELTARLTSVTSDPAAGTVRWTDDGGPAADLVELDYSIFRVDDQGAVISDVRYRALARATAARAVRLPVLPADFATYNMQPDDWFDRLLVTTTRSTDAEARRARYFTPDHSAFAANPPAGTVESHAARFERD